MAIGRNPRFRGRRPVREHRLNAEITEAKVRIVGDESEGGGVVTIEEAIARAKATSMDVVEVAKGQAIPIVKIIDYGKFKFEKSKKDKELKKRQRVTQIKEVKMGPKIDVGDFDRKCNLAKSFLEEGDNVKVTMRFRGREMAHTEIGLEKMKSFCTQLEEIAMVDKDPSLEGRLMTMVLRPRGKKS